MEEAHCDRTEFLSSYPLNIDEIMLIPGSLGRIRPHDPKVVVANLTCKMPAQHFKPYLKRDLPKRLHYANNRRIEDVHLLMERKWHIARKMPEKPRTRCGFFGDHGFDNKITSMRVLVYNNTNVIITIIIVCPLIVRALDLLGLKPVPNNGTHGSLNDLLKDPPFQPSMPEEVTAPSPPSDAEISHDLGCSCDDEWRSLDRSHSTQLPFGRPAVMFDTQYSLLHHVEFISGYSKELAMPLWTSYTLPPQVHTCEVLISCIRVDARVSADHSHSCSAYGQNTHLTYGFLFPPELATSPESRYDASLITNTVPMYPAFKRVWSYLQGTLLRRYAEANNGINVLCGPVFDYNYDGLRDTTEKIKEFSADGFPVPTHFYTVITSCQEVNQTVDECDGALKVFSFLLPNKPDNSEACSSAEDESKWVEDMLKLHTARVRDVEILTGLDLYRSTNLTYTNTLILKTYLETFERDE
uniref:Ectonucleotide pyrophosphatase/phosphodiesterase 2 n=1 Tax=Neolamprologus brichardi TaxID=32507 RepID=A0A3Q4I8V0_NEOBR